MRNKTPSWLDNYTTDYCNLSFSHITTIHQSILQKLQNDSIRLIYNLPKYSRTHISPLRNSLHWLPTIQRSIYKICLTVHLALHHKTPDYIHDIIQLRTTIHKPRTIHQFKLDNPPLLSSSSQNKAFSLHAPTFWNTLTPSLRSLTSTSTFMSKLKTNLFCKSSAYSTLKLNLSIF